MTRDRLKYAACQAAGYLDGSRESLVAQVAMDAALDVWPGPVLPVCVEFRPDGYRDLIAEDRETRRKRKREERNLYEETKWRTFLAVRQNPEAYGFAGLIGLVLLFWQIGSIVWPIVQWLMKKRYEGGDGEIQAAVVARPQ